MLARLRGTSANPEPAQDADEDGAFFRDDLPKVARDAQPDYSPARERMLEAFADARHAAVESGE
jgi:hypothetical protein